ncbi:unnamed protein product [Urochloa decumbens]|uniref:Protein kinase domain-containing protein n=1 Tax=Urochloa decumbens TaxID=240449 RepID=A0ABC9CLZ6_9POAL
MHGRTVTVARQLLVAAIAATLVSSSELLAAAAAGDQGPPIGLQGCKTTCGNVRVPYPFGIGPSGCYLPGFDLTCDTSHIPPQLFIGNGTLLQVTHISLDNSTVRLCSPAIDTTKHFSFKWGYIHKGTWGGSQWGLGDSRPYVLAKARNELILSGCHVFAELLTTDSDQIINSCGSVCNDDETATDVDEEYCSVHPRNPHCRKCSGIGCCQVPVPVGRASYKVMVKSIRNAVPIISDDPFTVLIAEQGWFNKNVTTELMSGADGTTVPVMLAWMVGSMVALPRPNKTRDGNETCPSDLGTTICHSSHSSCTSHNSRFSNHTISYTCRCWDGYQGNQYLPDGCQDINECNIPNKCYGSCTNIPGSYLCECPPGTSGNPYTRSGCVKQQESHPGLSIGLGIVSGAMLLFLILGPTFIIRKVKKRRKKKLREKFFKQNRGQLLQQLVCQRSDIAERMIVTLEELEKATNNFDISRKLGGGGHGIVYKGILSNLDVVAIKKSKIVIQKEIDEFINEVAILSQVNHINIVKLLGCCLETEVPLLVYEFIPNGTLHSHLHVRSPVSLHWIDRLRVAVETARALAYLHSFVSTPIIHRDIKSHNILLNDNLIAKLSDFGASRYIPVDQTGADTTVQGTFGYLDPMYYRTGHLTEKSDVYSFGVILIELLTRKKPVSYRSPEGYGLVCHFVTMLSGGLLYHILDPQVTKEGAGEVVDIALLAAICVKIVSEDRPTMRQVEMTLESIYAAKEYASSDMTDDDSEENYVQLNDQPIGGTQM